MSLRYSLLLSVIEEALSAATKQVNGFKEVARMRCEARRDWMETYDEPESAVRMICGLVL